MRSLYRWNQMLIDSSFPHTWDAEILHDRPLILPARHYVYPAQVEEVEEGALEVMVKPPDGRPFLATCALGFAGPLPPSGVWGCPHPDWLCTVSGGYAYLIDTTDPRHWEQIEYRPVTSIHPIPVWNLLIFSGAYSLIAWGREGRQWQTGRLSWEGLTIQGVRGEKLHGLGWDMHSDRELEFTVDLRTGESEGGGYLR